MLDEAIESASLQDPHKCSIEGNDEPTEPMAEEPTTAVFDDQEKTWYSHNKALRKHYGMCVACLSLMFDNDDNNDDNTGDNNDNNNNNSD